MEEEKTKDLEEQIKAVKEYKQGRAEKWQLTNQDKNL
jgi:hypothetical protein